MQLSERKKRILKSIIDAYIASGEPVGSKYLTDNDGFSVSSATIRSEMSELEHMGYLEQPHTSAGRVPTAMGYKTYVNGLMEQYLLSIEEINLLNELMAFKMNELGSVLEKASRIISQMTNYTSFAFINESGVAAKRYETVYIDGKSVLLVIVCEGESVRSRQIKLKSELSREELTTITKALNDSLSGVTVDKLTMPVIFSLEEKLGELSHFASVFVRAIYEMLSADETEKVHVEGATKLLQYPEFASVPKAKRVLELLEQRNVIADVVTKSDSEKLNVLISDEDGLPVDDSSLVVHPVTIDGKTIGAIGVIGPKRMDYKKVIAGLNYIVAGLSGEKENNEKKTEESDENKNG